MSPGSPVHMNGRIYDPLLGRFLSADTEIQYPSSLQSYNRYSYVRNNPLSLVDPTGFLAAPPPQQVVDMFQQGQVTLKQLGGEQPELIPILGIGVAGLWTLEQGTLAIEGGKDAYDAFQVQKRTREQADQNIADMKRRGTAPTAPQPTQPSPAEDHLNPNSIQNSQGDTVKATQAPAQEAKPDAPKGDSQKDSSKASDDTDSKDAASKKVSGDLKPLDKRVVSTTDMHAFKKANVGPDVLKFNAKVSADGTVVLVSKDGKTKVETDSTPSTLPGDYPKEKDKDKDKDSK